MAQKIICGICDITHDITDPFFIGCITALKRKEKLARVNALKEVVRFTKTPNGEVVITFMIDGRAIKVGRLDPDQVEDQKALHAFLTSA